MRLEDAADLVKSRRADGEGRETTMGDPVTAPLTRDARPAGDDGADGDEGPPPHIKHLPEVALSGWPIGSRSTMDSIPGRAGRLWL